MEVRVLVMSVGPYEKNWTVKYLEKIGGIQNAVVVLPKAFEDNAFSYNSRGIQVFLYDQDKYIDDDFEYFGFRPRNCGGIGRQGIAEAVEKLNDGNTIFFELDDDTASLCVRKRVPGGKFKTVAVREWNDFKNIVEAEYKMFLETGCLMAFATGASVPDDEGFIENRKIFNNFIMVPGNKWNFDGFKALCSDDYRFNMYNNLRNVMPMFSHNFGVITFHQSQGDRKDGNAPLYNSDLSWKKSYALKMMAPAYVTQRIVKEKNRVLFRENLLPSKLYPPILLTDDSGKVVGKAY